jgi:hypothetical protein
MKALTPVHAVSGTESNNGCRESGVDVALEQNRAQTVAGCSAASPQDERRGRDL